MRFKEKIVLVTGSSRGIGKEIALLFAQEGAKVVINYYQSKKEAKEVMNQSDVLPALKCGASCEVG